MSKTNTGNIIKKTKGEIQQIWIALDVLSATVITGKMRYAIARCRALMKPVIEGIQAQVGQEPDLSVFNAQIQRVADHPDRESLEEEARETHAVTIKAHEDWAAARQKALEEETDVPIYKIPMECEIDDINCGAPGTRQRTVQNQAIVEVLMDLWGV